MQSHFLLTPEEAQIWAPSFHDFSRDLAPPAPPPSYFPVDTEEDFESVLALCAGHEWLVLNEF
jgi:hypothetical protein